MRLSFDSIDEVKEFVKGLKGTRGGKADADEGAQIGGQTAPAPLTPPIAGAGFPGPAGFAPPAAGATQAGGAFPAAVANGPAPEVLALVQRIAVRGEAAVASGQPADAMLAWFRGQLGPEAANANWEQVKGTLLPKASLPTLENIAKLMAA